MTEAETAPSIPAVPAELAESLRLLREAVLLQAEHPFYPKVKIGFEGRRLFFWDHLLGLWQPCDPEDVQRALARRLEVIDGVEKDPFHYGIEPPMWRKISLWLARKRLECKRLVLVFYVLGGIRAGKTELLGHFTALHFGAYERRTKVGRYPVWLWMVHQTETRSKTLGQECFYRHLPKQWRETKFSKPTPGSDKGGRMNYTPGSGFTAMQCMIDRRLAEFVTGSANPKSLQGPELTMGGLDEEIEAPICKIVEERCTTHAAQAGETEHQKLVAEILQKLEADLFCELSVEEKAALMLGVVLHVFTPQEGWSKVVADALTGARVIEEEEAPDLPVYGPPDAEGERLITGHQTAPRVRQCLVPQKMVFNIWTQDNVFGGYEAVKGTVAGKDERTIRKILYGDVSKDWQTAYPGYDATVHGIDFADIPRDVTIRLYVDAAEARPLFLFYIGTDRAGRDYILNEWPRDGDDWCDGGDPGAWAVSGDGNHMDGEAGPAQQNLLDFGYRGYIKEMERLERQLEAWKNHKVDNPFIIHPDELLAKYQPVKLHEEQMDSRLGGAPTMNEGGKSTMMDDFNNLGRDFLPAAGDSLREGDKKINDALEIVTTGLFTGPRLRVARHCRAAHFMLATYTGKEKNKAKSACKDPRDALVFHLTNENKGYVDEASLVTRGGHRGSLRPARS